MSIDKRHVITGVALSTVMLNAGVSIAFADTDYRTITGNSVNFRTGPSTSYSSIGKFNKGDKVEFLEGSGSWAKVKYNEQIGYVHGDYVSQGASDIVSIKYVNASSLNVRSGASTNYSIIGNIKRGTKVEVISQSSGWSKIKYNSGIGYVSSQYLSDSTNNDNNDDSNNDNNETVIGTKYVDASSLNVRSGSSTSYSVIGTLSRGTKVEIISQSNGWSKIKYNSGIGYVSSQYLSDSNNDNNDNNETVIGTKYVNTSSLNVRSGASTSYSVIGKLSSGSKVEVTSESNGWSKIKYNNGAGYVSSQYLSDDLNSNEESPPPSSSASAVISYAKKLLGKPYVWGAEGPSSFDCSGFTSYVYKNAANVSIPRTSVQQSKYGKYINKSDIKVGDLVFFDTSGSNNGNVSHVGIYMGNNEFIHCSSSKGKVVISQFNSSYYTKAYVNARRVL